MRNLLPAKALDEGSLMLRIMVLFMIFSLVYHSNPGLTQLRSLQHIDESINYKRSGSLLSQDSMCYHTEIKTFFFCMNHENS